MSAARTAVVAIAAVACIAILAWSIVLFGDGAGILIGFKPGGRRGPPAGAFIPSLRYAPYLESLLQDDGDARTRSMLRESDPGLYELVASHAVLNTSAMVSLLSSGPMLKCNETLRDRWHDKHYDADGNFVPGHDHWEKHKQADGWRDNAFHSTVEMTRVLASIGLPAVQTSGNALGWARSCGIIEVTTDVDLMVDFNLLQGQAHLDAVVEELRRNHFKLAAQHGSADRPGLELRFWFQGAGHPHVITDLFFFGWHGPNLFTLIYYPDRTIQCPWHNVGFVSGDWDGHRILLPGSDAVGLHSYLEGKYKESYLELPPKSVGYRDCRQYNEDACSAYSANCAVGDRPPLAFMLREYVVAASMRLPGRQRDPLPFFYIGSSLDGELGVSGFGPPAHDVGILAGDAMAWTTALLLHDRTAGLSTFDVTFGKDVSDSRPCGAEAESAGLEIFATIRFSTVVPVFLRLWTTAASGAELELQWCTRRADEAPHCPADSEKWINVCSL